MRINRLNATHPIKIYLQEYNKIPDDILELAEIQLKNDFQKKALIELLAKDDGLNRKFESLAIKDIIEQIESEGDLRTLTQALTTPNLDTYKIIQLLKKHELSGCEDVNKIPQESGKISSSTSLENSSNTKVFGMK